jgi:superfamily II DNA or RNA helicase
VRIFAEQVAWTQTDGLSCKVTESLAPLVALSFDYGGTRVAAADERTRVFRSAGGGLETIERDGAREREARRILERLGALELACLDDVSVPPDCPADYVVRADGDEHTFCAFTARALAMWGSLGWRVEVDPAFPFRVVQHDPALYGSITPSDDRPNWFALELGVEIDGERIDLLPVVLELLDRLEGDGGLESLASSCRRTWALRVSDTQHVTLPLERLRALIRVVAELYQGQHNRSRFFPEVRAGALTELEGSFQGGASPIRWVDPAGVIERARARLERATPVEPPRGLQATLRPYQHEGVAFLQRLRASGMGGVLADEMGLGKTLQTIAHVLAEHEAGRLDAPALVVGPTTLVGNWSREIARFAPELRVVVLHGPERRSRWKDVPSAHVVVTTYPVLVRDEERFAAQRFHVAILDEAQAIKNARSQARQALSRVDAPHRLCLTGTPVENHLGELWSIFDFLSPGLLGEELSFRRFWRQPIERNGDAERMRALREAVGPFVLRRLKRDVAKELPPKTELVLPVELGAEQRELYEAIRVAAHADVRRAIRAKGLAASTVAILDALTKLRQVCCDPRLVAMEAARGVRASAKLEALLSLVEEQLAGGHRILVFSQFTSMLALVSEALVARGVAHLTLTGETRDRQRRVDSFEAGRADVFLISLKAGGTGLNLTSADTVIHYDPWWNPAAQAQATDRAYRIGQQRPVFVHSLIVAGSVEERVREMQERKRWLMASILGDGGAEGRLGEGEVDALFAPMDAAAT